MFRDNQHPFRAVFTVIALLHCIVRSTVSKWRQWIATKIISGDLNADVREGHLSAALSHLGNISYYVGEKNKTSLKKLESTLSRLNSLDDDAATLRRTVQHLVDNGVDLAKYPISLGPLLTFDPEKEQFLEAPQATAMLSREYREGFVCPTADKV